VSKGRRAAEEPSAAGGEWLAWVVLPLLAASVWLASEPQRYLDALNGPAAAELRALRPLPAPPAPKHPPRVVLLVLDGLRMDASLGLPALDALRAEGADVTLIAPYPSYSKPAYVTLATGASPLLTGVRNNRYAGPAPFDTVFHRAVAAGARTVCVGERMAGGGQWWIELLGEGCEQAEAPTDAAGFVDATRRALAGPGRFILLHWLGVDHAGHAHGGASGQYLAAARDADQLVGILREAAKKKRTVIAVVADHGHSDNGGHGGLEPEVVEVPFVLAGPGVRRGAEGRGRAEDVASTLAVLGGLALPAASEGAPLTQVLDLTEERRLAVEAQADALRTRLWRAWALGAGRVEAKLPGFPAARAAVELASRPWRPRWLRLGVAAALILMLLGFGRWIAGGLLPVWLVAGFLVPGTLVALMLGRGDPISFSAIDRAPAFLGRVAFYTLMAGVPLLLAGVASCRARKKGARTRRAVSVGMAMLPGAFGPWLVAVAWAGPRPFPDLPGPAAAFLPVLLAPPAMMTLFGAAVLIALATWLDGPLPPPTAKPSKPAGKAKGRK
jgi:hypothetical protein